MHKFGGSAGGKDEARTFDLPVQGIAFIPRSEGIGDVG